MRDESIRLVRGRRFLLEARDRKHDPLTAELHMLQLPDQLFDILVRSFDFKAGLPNPLQVIRHRFTVNHGVRPLLLNS